MLSPTRITALLLAAALLFAPAGWSCVEPAASMPCCEDSQPAPGSGCHGAPQPAMDCCAAAPAPVQPAATSEPGKVLPALPVPAGTAWIAAVPEHDAPAAAGPSNPVRLHGQGRFTLFATWLL